MLNRKIERARAVKKRACTVLQNIQQDRRNKTIQNKISCIIYLKGCLQNVQTSKL